MVITLFLKGGLYKVHLLVDFKSPHFPKTFILMLKLLLPFSILPLFLLINVKVNFLLLYRSIIPQFNYFYMQLNKT